MHIEPPDVEWKDGTPYSKKFGDVYFSKLDGPGESRYVFLEKTRLTERVIELSKGKFGGDINICEIGFGTGLNFLLTWEFFIQNSAPGMCLNYYSVEKYPLSKDDMKKIHLLYTGASGHLAEFSNKLIEQYPDRVPGFHRINLGKGVSLNLMFCDVHEGLSEIVLAGNKIDTWYFDGFNPANNPEIWNTKTYFQMAQLSAKAARLATFTAAGHVRRGLQEAGFIVTKEKGFGQKREMVTAVFQGDSEERDENSSPWFLNLKYKTQNRKESRVGIIGAGLAGTALAESFARRGWKVTVIEKEGELALGASGNPRGIFLPILHRDFTPISRLSLAGFQYVLRHIDHLEKSGYITGFKKQGILQALRPPKEHRKNEKDAMERVVKGAERLLDKTGFIVDAQQASELAGVQVNYDCVYYPNAGSLSPRDVCAANLHMAKNLTDVTSLYNIDIEHVIQTGTYEDPEWMLKSAEKEFGPFDAVVAANSFDAIKFEQTGAISIEKSRGQLFSVGATEITQKLRTPVSAGAYIIPSVEKPTKSQLTSHTRRHIVGATNDSFENDEPIESQNSELYAELCETLGGFPPEQEFLPGASSRVAYRAASTDHTPVMGPVPNLQMFKEVFTGLNHGENHVLRNYYDNPHKQNIWHPGFFILSGLGSRGIIYSHLGAEIVASLASSEPLPVEKSLYFAVHPARFIVRDLKKGRNF
ncbi:MAG: bifunctional tRNA (5-methylaminomethyl-2-thiouridine)(34)-methyltransferase MnmD/FAD-dependent 5-carboxymethylaminomethyl-2-thiouridine(34) oxidoreductase MnmC [Leptospirales bacterium]